METTYRCRKCRQSLEIQNAITSVAADTRCTILEQEQSSVLYLDVHVSPEWIQESVEKAGWVKGKLMCTKCKGRLGSFDFVSEKLCACGEHVLPPVHVLSSRIDCIRKRHLHSQRATKPLLHDETAASNSGVSLSTPDLARCDILNADSSRAVSFSDLTGDSLVDNAVIDNYEQLLEQNDILIASPVIPQTAKEKDDDRVYSQQGGTTVMNAMERTEQPVNCSSERNEESEGYDEMIQHVEHVNLFSFLPVEDNALSCESVIGTDGTDKLKKNGVDEEEIEIPSDALCAVCLEMFYRPHRCDPCGHVFCECCLRQICKQTPTLTPCPLCRDVICACIFEKDLNESLQSNYKKQFDIRCQESRKQRNTYPLPSCSPAQYKRLQRENVDVGLRPWSYRTEQNNILARCAQDILIRLAWLLLMFIFHNILLSLDHWLEWQIYAGRSVKFNYFLWTLTCKLILFGVIYCLKKYFRLRIENQFTGQAVLFVFIFSVLWDTDSWIQFMLNMAVIGSLFL